MSCQPHRVTSGQSNSGHKEINISKLFSLSLPPPSLSLSHTHTHYKTNHFANINIQTRTSDTIFEDLVPSILPCAVQVRVDAANTETRASANDLAIISTGPETRASDNNGLPIISTGPETRASDNNGLAIISTGPETRASDNNGLAIINTGPETRALDNNGLAIINTDPKD